MKRKFESIISRTLIDKGWSGDEKYCAQTRGGEKYLLRISNPDRFERRRREFENMQKVADLGVPVCRPVEFGLCDEGVYMLLAWIDGWDGEAVIPALPEEQQYAHGIRAGRILAKMHTIPAPDGISPWGEFFDAKIDRKLSAYANCPLKYDGGEAFVRYINANRHLIAHRPQCYQHGDYHIGNMMLDKSGQLVVIDFDKDDYGDPWEEFNRIVWSAQASPFFASGMVDGYFDGCVPVEFWNLLLLYICSNTIGSLPWAIPFGEDEVETMRRQAAQVMEWYDGMRRVVPTWYNRR